MSNIQVINPATEEIINQYKIMSQDEVNTIINLMYDEQEKWARTAYSTRIHCLMNAANLLRQDKEKYAKLMTLEMGKPISQSISEIEKCAKAFDYYAEMGEKFLEPEIIETEFHKSYRSFQPLGIIFAIMPWNFPFWQVVRFAVPNLMLGNAGLLKHAPNSMGTALAIEQLFLQAGFPKNLFRSLIIDVDLAPAIIHHPKISGVTLTGSNKAGQSVAKEAGMALKKLVLELGGSDPYIILEDADIALAAEKCVQSRLGINAGQSCIAAKRLIVVNKMKDNFIKNILENARQYKIGDPLDPKTNLGPLARNDLREKLHDQVERSIAAGARCILGGEIPDKKGYFYPATILTDVPVNSPAFLEEIFGPVISIINAVDEEEAVQLANQSPFGLGAAIFTQDLQRGERLAREKMQAGTCVVNTFVASDPRLPFGGIKQSGYGRELSREGMHEFANIKTVVIAS